MEPTVKDEGNLFTTPDRANGVQLLRVVVTVTNVDDLPTNRTAKAGTKYEIMPGFKVAAKKCTWGLSMAYEKYNAELEQHVQEINDAGAMDLDNPYHWMNILIRKASILTIPEGFTWDQITLHHEKAADLAVDVLQRIGNDFLFRTNAQKKRQMQW